MRTRRYACELIQPPATVNVQGSRRVGATTSTTPHSLQRNCLEGVYCGYACIFETFETFESTGTLAVDGLLPSLNRKYYACILFREQG
jgi:hypothetical protein